MLVVWANGKTTVKQVFPRSIYIRIKYLTGNMDWGHLIALCMCLCLCVCVRVCMCVKLDMKIERMLVSRKALCIHCDVLFSREEKSDCEVYSS